MKSLLFKLIDRVLRFFYGDDVFVSYSRADGATYAAGLANELVQRGLSCRLDQWATESGSEMPESLKKALKRSMVLVLVGTEGAARSPHVGEEVRVVHSKGRMIVPIVFDGVVLRNGLTPHNGVLRKITTVTGDDLPLTTPNEAIWAAEVEGLAIACEHPETLHTGIPTASIVNRIEKTCTFWIRNRRLNFAASAVGILLIALVGASLWAGKIAVDKGIEARQQTELAAQAETKAREQGALAEQRTQEAEAATLRATQADAAAKKAQDRAVAATRKADEQSRLATRAEARATAAADRARVEELKAQSNLARTYYSQAQAEAGSNPARALLWAQRAAETAPPQEKRRGIYQLRALHLTQNAPATVVNLPGPVAVATFNPAQDQVVTVSDREELSVWETKGGVRLPAPQSGWKSFIIFATNIAPPIFSPDGRWIAALTWDEPPDHNKIRNDLHLHVWEAATGKDQLDFYDTRFEAIEHAAVLRFSPDSSAIILSNWSFGEGELLIWDVLSRHELASIRTAETPLETRNLADGQVVMSRNPKHNRLVTFTKEQRAATDAASTASGGEPSAPPSVVTKMEVKDILSGASLLSIPGAATINFADFTDDGERVVTITSDENSAGKTLRIWNVNGGPSEPRPFVDETVLAMNREGTALLVTANDNEKIYLLDLTTQERKLLLETGKVWFDLKADFSADGKTIITRALEHSGDLEEIEVWDVATGLRSAPPFKRTGSQGFSLSPSSMTLAQCSTEGVVEVRSLRQSSEIETLKTKSLPLDQGHKFVRAFLTPNQRSVLTLDKQKHDTLLNPMKMQLWDLANGRPLWRPGGVSTALIEDIDFLPAKNVFVITAGSEDEPDPRRDTFVTVRDLANGEAIPGFRQPSGNFKAAAFCRDGSKLVTIAGASGNWRLQQWNAETGAEVPAENADVGTLRDGTFYSLTRYGEFVLMLNFRDSKYSKWKQFTVRSTVPSAQDQRLTFDFARYSDAVLAAALLKQAQAVSLTENEAVADFGSGLAVSIRSDKRGAIIINRQTGEQFLAPPSLTVGNDDWPDVNVKNGLVLTTPNFDTPMRVWEAGTGMPLSEGMWHEGAVRALAFTEDGNQVLSLTENGLLRLWYIGEPSTDVSPWLKGLVEAATGMTVINDLEIQRLTPEDLVQIKTAATKSLQRAAQGGDKNAQFVLGRLKR